MCERCEMAFAVGHCTRCLMNLCSACEPRHRIQCERPAGTTAEGETGPRRPEDDGLSR